MPKRTRMVEELTPESRVREWLRITREPDRDPLYIHGGTDRLEMWDCFFNRLVDYTRALESRLEQSERRLQELELLNSRLVDVNKY